MKASSAYVAQLELRVAELEAQLEAVGAGGVSPLMAQQPASPTAGMNIAQRILHVGGRDNAAGYVEFGSIQAVEALVRQVLRDLPAQQPAPSPAVASKAVLAAIRAANMQLVRTGDDEFMLVTYKNAEAQCDGGKCGIGGYCDDCPTPQADTQPAPAWSEGDVFRALIEFLLHADEAMTFLRCWNEGNFEACRLEWPEAPPSLYPDAARAPADSVLYDPKAVLEIFNSARAGSEKPVGYLRGILAVIAHWESRPEPHRWMVPAKEADSVLDDAALLHYALSDGGNQSMNWQDIFDDWDGDGYFIDALRAARKQGGA